MAKPSRREFLKSSTAAVVAGPLFIPDNVHIGGDEIIRIGLIGCGARGTGAAGNALSADKNVKLVAMGDAFADRLKQSHDVLKEDKAFSDRVDVKDDMRFVGFDNYKGVIANVDAVLLCTPPHFRPIHLKAAIEAGKHVFAEKPVAVDAPGVRSVIATCAEAAKKKLSVVSGLCLRYSNGFKEAVKRIHAGACGDIVALQANDYRGPAWAKPRDPKWNDMEWQMRNWYNFTWLSGDFTVEQHVHYLDVCSWVMKNQYPVRAVSIGGREVRREPEHGNIYDHFSTVFEYENGVKLFSNTRKQPGCYTDISARVLGNKGQAILSDDSKIGISGANPWEGPDSDNDNNFYQAEHEELFAGMRSGKPINNGEYMAKSTLLAIMERMSAYTGQMITWEQAMNSQEDLSPPKYEWGTLATPPVAVPGKTKFF